MEVLNKPMETQSYKEQDFGLISQTTPNPTASLSKEATTIQSLVPGEGNGLQEDLEHPRCLRHRLPEQTQGLGATHTKAGEEITHSSPITH